MSIPVDLADLPAAVAEHGSGYLLTVSGSGRVKVVAAHPRAVDGALVVAGAGRGSQTNIERNPSVTLLFPPARPGGHTLLVDGLASLSADDVTQVRVEPHHAVLHRPATPGEDQA